METIIYDNGTGEVHKMTLDIFEEPLRIVDYSDKSIAVFGSTREFRTDLLKAGGKFVPKLDGGAGWVFSKKHQEKVQDLVYSLNKLFKIKRLSCTIQDDNTAIADAMIGEKLQIIPITDGTFYLVGDTMPFETELIDLGCQKIVDDEQVKWYFTRNKLKAVNALKNAVNKMI